MKYLDSGKREPSQSLGNWLREALKDGVGALRIQTGFFSIDGLALVDSTLATLSRADQPTAILIGSNECSTLRYDIAELVRILALPRPRARLGIVSFSGGYFHPKVYHVVRTDGSQAAYVGSANLTAQGLAVHVEAGLALDTRDGDDPLQLTGICKAIDAWFTENYVGVTPITSVQDVDDLVTRGVLALAPPPRAAQTVSEASSVGSGSGRPRLQPIFRLPAMAVARHPAPAASGMAVAEPAASVAAGTALIPPSDGVSVVKLATSTGAAPSRRSVPRSNFPPYLLFDPHQSSLPTSGLSALTGVGLPDGAPGVVIRLNKDSARRFLGGVGTANISIPVATLGALRFGFFGRHDRPRAEYSLRVRYVSDAGTIDGGTLDTNVMGYGFTAGEAGHGDVRMLIPAGVTELGGRIKASGQAPPTVGDLALLEWPTSADPSFGLTFVDSNSALGKRVIAEFSSAEDADELVGNGACWLPPTISPPW